MADTYTPNLNLKKPGYDSPADIKDLNDNFDKIDNSAGQLSQQMADYRTAVNLLDNSDWRAKKNIVNQRGQDVYTQNDDTIDRWELWNGTVNVTEFGYISTTGQLYQKIDIPTDKTYTFAVKTGDGIAVAAGIPANFANATLGNTTIALTTINGYVEVVIQPTPGYDVAGAIWAALYEGAYTAETLPPYVPKGYAAELAECLRYFEVLGEWNYNSYGDLDFTFNHHPKVSTEITRTVVSKTGTREKIGKYSGGWSDMDVSCEGSASTTRIMAYGGAGIYGFKRLEISADL